MRACEYTAGMARHIRVGAWKNNQTARVALQNEGRKKIR